MPTLLFVYLSGKRLRWYSEGVSPSAMEMTLPANLSSSLKRMAQFTANKIEQYIPSSAPWPDSALLAKYEQREQSRVDLEALKIPIPNVQL